MVESILVKSSRWCSAYPRIELENAALGNVMIRAICFRCGKEKDRALERCKRCQAMPESRRHQIRSLCMSAECLKQENLAKCLEYVKSKKRFPKFHDKVKQQAIQILEQQLQSAKATSQSIELSSSFFDFSDMSHGGNQPEKIVLVHVIGRHKEQQDAPSLDANRTQKRTYHQVWWQVGKDISLHDYDTHKDSLGELYVYYRWMNELWTSKCVSKAEFDKLKTLEDGKRLA